MSNILKQYRVAGEDKNVRVINSNSMIKQIFADSISRPADSYTGISSDAQSSLEKTKSLSPDTQESGFNDGINAAVVTEIDVSAEKERLLEEAKLEADSILDKAKAEASRLLDEAKQRAQILYADNKSKGYEDGLAECQREFDEKEISLRQELSDKESSLKSKYDAYSKELESDLIDAIIQVFNKVFKIQFDDKKDILFHLVENTMSNIEVGKEFRIHVAHSNYKFMMSHLAEIQERIGNDIDIEVVNDASQRERAESLGYTVVDPPSIIATHLTEVIRSHIAELLTRQDVQNLVNNLKESNPVIVDELIPKLLGLGEIQKVLQNLLSEGISIRDLLTIFETLADHAQTTRDTDVLTEYVRQGLKRAISSKYFPANETTSVITLDPAVEQEIMSSVKQTEQGSYLSLDPDRIKAIIKSVETEIGKLESLGKSAIIITSPIVRMYFKKMTEDYFKDLIVLSYNEVESNVELQSVGMVTA